MLEYLSRDALLPVLDMRFRYKSIYKLLNVIIVSSQSYINSTDHPFDLALSRHNSSKTQIYSSKLIFVFKCPVNVYILRQI
jgi:hypothetical protein